MVLPNSHRVSRVPWYLGVCQKSFAFRLRGFHLLWPAFPCRLAKQRFCNSFNRNASLSRQIPRPPYRNACTLLRDIGLGSSRFARRYFGNHYCFLFLRVLRCFSSPGALPLARMIRHYSYRVSPFGYLRIYACLRLPEAFRR